MNARPLALAALLAPGTGCFELDLPPVDTGHMDTGFDPYEDDPCRRYNRLLWTPDSRVDPYDYGTTAEDPGRSIRVRIVDGALGDEILRVNGIPGTSTVEGHEVVFVADEPFPTGTSLLATLNWRCGRSSYEWQTPGGAQGIPDAEFVVHLNSRYWIGAGTPNGEWDAELLTDSVLIGISNADAEAWTMDLLLAVGDETEQDVCVPTAGATNRSSAASPTADAVLGTSFVPSSAGPLPLYDTRLNVRFAITMRALTSVYLGGLLDVSGLDALHGDACAWLGAQGVPCRDCPNGEPTCIDFRVADLPSTPVDVPVVARGTDDIAADPVCAP